MRPTIAGVMGPEAVAGNPPENQELALHRLEHA